MTILENGTTILHKSPLRFWDDTVDGRNPARVDREYPMIYKVLYIPGGAGFLPTTVRQQGSRSCPSISIPKTALQHSQNGVPEQCTSHLSVPTKTRNSTSLQGGLNKTIVKRSRSLL